jgi:uncharacterized protein (DUF302 family)
MITSLIRASCAALLATTLVLTLVDVSYPATAEQVATDDGIVRVKSSYAFDETVSRLKADIATKGITFFLAVDQSKLASDSKITLTPSTLLVFGNPALGTQFITSNPSAGLDWPVRLLVHQDAKGDVWTVYTDFAWIARRHRIKDRDAAFTMASKVIASITSSVTAR